MTILNFDQLFNGIQKKLNYCEEAKMETSNYKARVNAFIKEALKEVGIIWENYALTDSDVVRVSELELRAISLKIRVASEGNKYFPLTDPVEEDAKEIIEMAREWIKKQPLKSYVRRGNALIPDDELSEKQRRNLVEVTRYPYFYKQLKFKKIILENYFKWVLIENGPVPPFVEFYGVCQNRLKKAFLHKRIGYFEPSPYKFK